MQFEGFLLYTFFSCNKMFTTDGAIKGACKGVDFAGDRFLPWSTFLSLFSWARHLMVCSFGTRGTVVTDGLTRLSGTGTSWLAAGSGRGAGMGGQCTDWVIRGGQCMDWVSSESSLVCTCDVHESSSAGSRLLVISSFMLGLKCLFLLPANTHYLVLKI